MPVPKEILRLCSSLMTVAREPILCIPTRSAQGLIRPKGLNTLQDSLNYRQKRSHASKDDDSPESVPLCTISPVPPDCAPPSWLDMRQLMLQDCDPLTENREIASESVTFLVTTGSQIASSSLCTKLKQETVHVVWTCFLFDEQPLEKLP